MNTPAVTLNDPVLVLLNWLNGLPAALLHWLTRWDSITLLVALTMLYVFAISTELGRGTVRGLVTAHHVNRIIEQARLR